MAQSRYFRYQAPRRQSYANDDPGTRGLAAGVAAGKLLSGLAGAFQDIQKNAVANRLMNTEDAPRAQLVDPGSQTVTAPGSDGSTPTGPTQDLGTAPIDSSDTTFTNPATGNIEPLQGQGTSDADLASAMAAARLGSGPTVGSSTPPGPVPSDQDLLTAMNSKPTPTPATTSRVPNTVAPGVSTAGTRPHTGGVEEMELQQKMQEMQAKKAAAARQAKIDAQTEEDRPMDQAIKRAQLAHTLAETEKTLHPPQKEDKNAPPANIDSEPVRDTNQLGDYVDNQYGNGTYSGLVGRAAASSSGDELAVAPTDPNAPESSTPLSIFQTNPDGTPKYDADGIRATVPGATVPVPVGGKDPTTGAQKVINMPLKDAQIYVRQTNLQRIKQGLPPFRVPGEEQDIGTSPNKPFVAHNQMEAQSRAPGTYVKLPSGQVVLWQGLKRTRKGP
jgi:hypothetical protein